MASPRTSWWAWCAATCGMLLPLLSSMGVRPATAEYLTVLTSAVCLGLAVHRFALGVTAQALWLTAIAALTVLLQFGKFANQSLLGTIGLAAAAASLFLFSRREPGKILRVLAIVGIAQTLSGIALAPSAVTVLREAKPPLLDRPAVIHVLLDESTGLAAYPADAVPPSEVAALAERYVSRGFTVFSRAYSAGYRTELSVSRLFNASTETPLTALLEGNSPKGWHVHRALALDELSREFAFDLTYSSYIYLRPALKPAHRVVHELVYEGLYSTDALIRNGAPFGDRARIAAAMTWNWLVAIQSPLATWPSNNTTFGKALTHAIHPLWRTHPLVAHDVLADFQKRMDCCLQRGTYAYAHILHPHYPFVFDAACKLRPTSEWVNNTVHHLLDTDTLETRRHRYRMHLEQAKCATSQLTALADQTRRRQDLSDTVILVHGDHGSRITAAENDSGTRRGYGDADRERDNRGTFLAIRMPGLNPGIVDTPVRIDDFYTMLVHSNFRSLRLDALPKRQDSPYRSEG